MIRTASDLILLIVTAARGVEESGLDLTDDPLETSSLSLASPVIIASPSQKVISLYPELSLLVLVLRRVWVVPQRWTLAAPHGNSAIAACPFEHKDPDCRPRAVQGPGRWIGSCAVAEPMRVPPPRWHRLS